MNRQSKEYETWIMSSKRRKKKEHEEESTECNRFMKLDCVGYVQKRMGISLKELKKKTKGKLGDGIRSLLVEKGTDYQIRP